MATYRTLPSGNIQVQIRLTGHPSISATFKTKAEAKHWADLKTGKVGKENRERTVYQQTPKGYSYTLEELGEQFCRIGLKGRKTQEETVGHLARVIRELKHLRIPMELDQITQRDINRYRMYRLERVANATCRKDIQLIGRIYKFGNREYFLDLRNPVDGVAIPPIGKPRSRIVERHELEALMAELPPIMATFIELAYETAMRRGEIINLTPKVLNLGERYLTVIDGKTGDRPVPLTTRAVEILRSQAAQCKGENSKLFPIAPHSVSTAFRRARKRAGLSNDICLHQLRHTRITIVARKGFNQAQIMMVSGHRDTRSVQRYTHLNVQDVVGLLD